jgi:hypothetical protein
LLQINNDFVRFFSIDFAILGRSGGIAPVSSRETGSVKPAHVGK